MSRGVPDDVAEDFAQIAEDHLDIASRSLNASEPGYRQTQALIGAGYALLSIREQLAGPRPRRHWLRRGGAR